MVSISEVGGRGGKKLGRKEGRPVENAFH